MEGIGGGEKAFQLISRHYKSARQALLRDWVFEDSDEESGDDDENEGGEEAFQLISKPYESARQALLRDWVFETHSLVFIGSIKAGKSA